MINEAANEAASIAASSAALNTEKQPPAPRVLSLGDLVVDLVLSIPSLPVQASQHQPVSQVRLEPGGAGNFLIAGTRLGMHMLALGTLGADALGEAVYQILQDEGVDTRGVIRQPGSTSTTVVVLVDQHGSNVFLGGYGQGPEIALPDAWRAELVNAQAVFASGYTLAEGRDAQAALELMALAHQAGIPVFFDPGPDMARATAAQVQAVLSHSMVLLLTEEEIPFLSGGLTGLAAARSLLDYRPELVCVKRGPQGCLLLTHQASVEHPGFRVSPVDPTGAGDSFAAALIYAYLKKWELADMAAFANAMGAAKVQKLGSGRQVPTASEVRAILEQHDPTHPFFHFRP